MVFMLKKTSDNASKKDMDSSFFQRVFNKEYLVYYVFSDIGEFDIILHKDLGGARCLSY